MPETRDFDAIPTRIQTVVAKAGSRTASPHAQIAEQLRLIWNARGAGEETLRR
jgi:hypothetical protein